jgi:thymidylate synthase ThyX
LKGSLGRKRAKESARFFLPYNKQLDFDMMINLRSFVNFQKLRNNSAAQLEIQDIAQKMLRAVKDIPELKYSLEAFNLG